ncbi:MAG: sodium:proton antiporter [Gammaproteobacteria bacterium]|nr:sodium:proton antiporter [Gammaproteobacteria bacterium]
MTALLTLGFIGFVGFLCQWLAHQVKLPAILFLLLSGMLLGPAFSILDPDALFGDLLFPYISLSVAVILFEGALTLKKNEFDEIGRPVRRMVTVGVVVSALLMTLAARYLTDLSWSLSALFGAIMVVTGPTVIMPMLKSIRPISKIADVLRWEGIIIDPIGALVAVLVYEWIVVQETAAALSEVLYVFLGTVFSGMLVGLGAGYLLGVLLRNHLIPEKLHNFASLAMVCFIFALSDSLMHESGLLAVTVMGMLLTNMRGVHIHSILEFKESLTTVFVSALFIILAARIDTSAFAALGWSALLLLVVMQFIARPLKIALSFAGSSFTWREQALIAWVGPRGIVAAAVAAVFALKLEVLGIAGADKLVPLTFLIIIGTVVFQSLSAGPLARILGVALPETHGVVIIGSNLVSVAIGKALESAGIGSLVCDTSWEKLRAARNIGLQTYYGNPSSEHASLHINYSPYGYMLGLSNHFEYNLTQANTFAEEFGFRNVFVLPPNESTERFQRHVTQSTQSGRMLFNEQMAFYSLKNALNDGGKIKSTGLSAEYDYSQWLKDNPDALPLFALQADKELMFNTIDTPLTAEEGSKLFYLAKTNDQPQEK